MEQALFAVLSLTAACTFGATGGGEASSGTTSAGDDATNGTSGSAETVNDAADDGVGPASTSTSVSTTTMGADVDTSDGTSTDTPTSDDTESITDGTTGSAALLANCAEVLADDDAAVDGVYTIDVDGEGGEDPLDVYCDMSTEGGGWTLVFAYGFTSYDPFVTGANAVSVRPNWPITEDDPVPVSTTPPLGLDEEGAVDFDLWPDLGQSFMVRSNITNGIVCEELGGSLVSGMGGAIDCTLIEDVTGMCTDVVPTSVASPMYGFGLRAGQLWVYWDADMSAHYPTHDPCGTNAGNQLTGVTDPFGAILVRP